MKFLQLLRSIRTGGVILIIMAFISGLTASALWVISDARWKAYLDHARYTGAVLYDSLQNGNEPPRGVSITSLSDSDVALAERGRFGAISESPPAALVTNISIRPTAPADRPSASLTLAILSPDLQYPLASIASASSPAPAETMGTLVELLATYCSNPVLIVKSGDGSWVRVEGQEIWSCAAAPMDYRLFAIGLALVSLGVLTTLVLNSSAQFIDFARTLRDRKRIGGPEAYDADGLLELRDIVSAVNSYLATERGRLVERAEVLSGVSHDLGTPATRLKLRTALIQDEELRAKLVSDIEAMTGIIESVLTYSRTELDVESPRRVSLTSLIEAIVADYQDVGSPVELRSVDHVPMQSGKTVFMSRQGMGPILPEDKVVAMVRPIALGRALSNLIDNALKYGRRAKVGLEKDADRAVIIVEDEGGGPTAQDIEKLMAPFKRGTNSKGIKGHGLGLTIVSTIADMHGGSLTFEPAANGLLAKLSIQRQ